MPFNSRQTGMVRQALWFFVLAFTALLAGAAAAQSSDQDWPRCIDDAATDNVMIEACTAVIRSGHETDANLSIAFKNLCLAHNDKGDHDRAIQDCDQAIRLHPGYVMAYLYRGHAYFNKADYDRAIQDYDQAIAFGSNDATTFVERGAAYHRKGDEVRAITDLNQAITLDSDDAIAFYVRGAAYQAVNHNDQAILDYSYAIKLAPRFAVSFYRRGVLKIKMGDIKGGEADIAQARTIDPHLGK
ncbi:MAG TPA: tetratricopeptide repeat protein [Rhizomicrobium sp.]|nr:tetratricopeptide repeat protein [Rhizomicrobium sp.]